MASGDGYQIKKTSPIANKAIKKESDKWLRKNFRRLDIQTSRHCYFKIVDNHTPKIEVVLMVNFQIKQMYKKTNK